jgi:hypothetical protein
MGIPEGFRSGLKTIVTGYSPMSASKYEYRPSAFGGKLGRVINAPVNLMEASDSLNYNIALRSELNSLAVRKAKMKGLTGQALVDDVAKTLRDPPAELIEQSSKTAEYRLFRQEPGDFTSSLLNLRESVNIGGFKPLKYFVPFLRTPVNLLKYGLERSPAGFLNPKLIRNLKAKDPEAADQLARALMGSMIAGGIAFYFGNGKITGAAPTSINARDRFYREGKQPYSLKIGDRWVSYQQLEPFNQTVSLVASIVNAIDDNDKTVPERVAEASVSIGKNFVSQTYMSGLSDIINAISDPQRYGSQFIENMATAAVPFSSAVRTVQRATDTTIRKPENIAQNVQAGIPGLSKQVPAKTNVFGDESKRSTPWWSPVSVAKEDNSPMNQELNRLEVNTGFVGSLINTIKLTADEQKRYQEIAGPLEKQAVIDTINSAGYRKMIPEEQKKAIERAVNAARDNARNQLNKEQNNKFKLNKAAVKRRVIRRSSSSSYNAAKRRIIKSK